MERIKEPCSMNKQPSPKHQIEGSNKKKIDSELPRPDYPARGADNLAPLKKNSNCCCSLQFDRSGRKSHTT
jgi:hypothetical protein